MTFKEKVGSLITAEWEEGWIYDPKKIGNYEDETRWDGDYVYTELSPAEYFE
jgi:hypothetical protein